jgi:hypothetical protein
VKVIEIRCWIVSVTLLVDIFLCLRRLDVFPGCLLVKSYAFGRLCIFVTHDHGLLVGFSVFFGHLTNLMSELHFFVSLRCAVCGATYDVLLKGGYLTSLGTHYPSGVKIVETCFGISIFDRTSCESEVRSTCNL